MSILLAAIMLGQIRTAGTYTPPRSDYVSNSPGYGLGSDVYLLERTTVDQVNTGRVFCVVRDYYLIEKGKGTARWKPYQPMVLKKGDKVRLSMGRWL